MSGMRNEGVSVSRVQQERKGKLWRQAISRNMASIPWPGRKIRDIRDRVRCPDSVFAPETFFSVRSTVDVSGMTTVMPRTSACRMPVRRRGPGWHRGRMVTTPGPSTRSCSRRPQRRSAAAAGATGTPTHPWSISSTARTWMLHHDLDWTRHGAVFCCCRGRHDRVAERLTLQCETHNAVLVRRCSLGIEISVAWKGNGLSSAAWVRSDHDPVGLANECHPLCYRFGATSGAA